MKLKILTWNLSYAYGLGSEGTAEYFQRTRQHFADSLDAMSAFIKNLEIDIVLLQEVDFHSRRSHYINQLDWLSRKSGLLYRNELVTWNSLYVPFPGVSPKNHFGRIQSGGGILSRFPIRPLQNDLLPKPRENSKLYNFFYLHRFLQMVAVELPERELRLCNLHLEAFSQDNRELHLIKLQDRIKDYEIEIAAGDFNGPCEVLPQFQDHWTAKFPGEPTFPSLHADQILDGAIVQNTIKDITVQTLNTGTLSDHFPVLFTVSL